MAAWGSAVDSGKEGTPEGFLAAIVESSHSAIVGEGLDGTILSWNQAAENIFGYSSREAVGHPISIIIPDDRLSDIETILSAVREGRTVDHFETKRRTRAGAILDVSLTVSPIRNSRGEVIGASKIARDITDAKRSERELEKKALQLQTLYEAGRAMGSTLEPRAIYSRMRELLGRVVPCDGFIVSNFDPAEALIRVRYAWVEGNLLEATAIPPIPLAPAGKGLQSRVIRSGSSLLVPDLVEALKDTQTVYRVAPDGTLAGDPAPEDPQSRSLMLVPVKLESEVIGIVQVSSLTENAYAPTDLDLLEGLVNQMATATTNADLYQRSRESEAHYRLFADAIPQIAWSLDAQGRLDFTNARFREFTGIPETVTEGPLWRLIAHQKDADRAQETYDRAVAGGEVWEQEIRLRRHDDRYRWHLCRLVPVRDDSRIVRWFGTCTDIHEKRQAEDLARREGEALRASREELRSLNAELERRVVARTAELQAANEEMEGFTYSVSHDLRAPLRSIMASSLILLEDYGRLLPPEGTDSLQRQAAAAKKLSTIIDDLLQYARLGRKTIEPHEVHLSEVAQILAQDIIKRNPDRSFEVRIQPGLRANGDPNLLAMLLQNLLDNAVKFTAGRPLAVIEFGQDHEGYFVRDNGAGFDMQYVSKLFRPFERLHREAEFSGTGIGLANVKRIVERHHGKVWADATPDRGATFYFTLGNG